jgi:hypothetical protein
VRQAVRGSHGFVLAPVRTFQEDPKAFTRRGGMRYSKRLLLVVLVVLSSLLVWACGGEEEEGPRPPEAPTATSPAEKTPLAGETPAVDKTPEAREDGGEFGDLAQRFAKATFKATYELSTSAEGQVTEGTMTWYKKGDSLRIDIEGEVEGEQMSASIITRPDQAYFCMQIPEMVEGCSCFSAPGAPGEGVGEIISGLEEALTDPEVDVVSTSSRRVAGQDADCFTVRSPEFEGDGEICLTEEGIPLSFKGTTEGVKTSIEATDFSRDVSDDDFEPPYPVSEGFPGLPGIDSEMNE